jgi:hypothetical protein
LGFCLRPGFTVVPNAVTNNPYGTLKSPKAFCQYITGDFPQKIMLGNTVGDTWSVRLVEWRNCIFIENDKELRKCA